jgi:hypothetical protein
MQNERRLIYMVASKEFLKNEIDFLTGNINRMCVSDNAIEITEMCQWAYKRLEDIYQFNLERVNEKKSKVCDNCKHGGDCGDFDVNLISPSCWE